MKDAPAALDRLCDPEAEVSAHYLIAEAGEVHVLVAETDRAWHAGAGSWGACRDINSASIGIELDNDGTRPFSEAQMAALESLLDEVRARWRIPPERVIGHSDMAPGRKSDPGPLFPWQRLAASGRSVWPSPRETGGAFAEDLRRFGYPGDVAPELLLAAFRMRFRPDATGPIDGVDRQLAADLAARFPVDPGLAGA